MSEKRKNAMPLSARGKPRYARGKGITLGVAFRTWINETPPKVVLSGLIGLTIFRIWFGQWSVWDLIPLVVLVVVQPFVEWLIHVYVLHSEPLPGGFRLDYNAARHHRAHHRDPWDLRFAVMPITALSVGTIISAIAWWLLMPTTGAAITGMLVTTAAGAAYEWTHFLIHTNYKPKTTIFRNLRRWHNLHHYKNENYWQGVTRLFADFVLGTAPDKKTVPTSPTCRTLGREDEDPVHVN